MDWEVDRGQFPTIADWLGDSPYTAIPVHLLRRGLCRAYVVGAASLPDAVLVQDDHAADEPAVFGADAAAMWRLARVVPGWDCISVPAELAEDVAAAMRREHGYNIRRYGDVYFHLTRPVARRPHDHARLLTGADVALLDSAPEEMRGYGFSGADGLLRDGFAAAVVVDGEVRAIAQTYARTGAYADIGVYTAEGYRRRGYAAACASLVIEQVQTRGETPAWSTGEDNHASMRVAEKLGFEQYGERTYLIPSD